MRKTSSLSIHATVELQDCVRVMATMNKLLGRIVESCRHNLGRVPDNEFRIEDHVQRGRCHVVERLLQANPQLSRHRDMFGNPLLILAVSENQLEMCQLLLKFGCDVNAPDAHGATALHHAVDLNRVEIASLLLIHGASPHFADENGDLPIDWAEPSRREDFHKIISRSA